MTNKVSDLITGEWRKFQSESEERNKAEKLPSYVKCMFCGGRPKWGDLLGQVIKDSTALAHESCAKEHGLIFGMNAGAIQIVDGKIKAKEGK